MFSKSGPVTQSCIRSLKIYGDSLAVIGIPPHLYLPNKYTLLFIRVHFPDTLRYLLASVDSAIYLLRVMQSCINANDRATVMAYRVMHVFLLDLKTDEEDINHLIDYYKRKRQFSRIIREGIRLIWSLGSNWMCCLSRPL
jgi:hypothetical protein